MKEHIQYDYIADNYFSELKEKEILNERLTALERMDPFAGRYFSLDYIRRQILKQTDEEITEIDSEMEQEIKDGKLIDPLSMPAMEHQQMEMSLQPEQEEEEYQGVDKKDYKRGEF